VKIIQEQIGRKETEPGASGGYLQAVIDGLEDELLVIDRDFRIVQANQSVLTRHGKKREEVIGQYCYDISHGLSEACHPPHHECPITRVWETGKPYQTTHLHLYEINGAKKERYLDIIASPIFDTEGKVVFVVELMRDVTEAKLLDMENARLHQELEKHDQVRGELLNQVFSIQEEERKRIARELHDETSQSLAALAASLEAITATLPEKETSLKARLKSLQTVALRALDEMRRLMYELRPTLLDDFGLVAAIRFLAERELKPAGITTRFKVNGKEKRLAPKLENTLFRVIQEALNNIARHSHANRSGITLTFRRRSVGVRITDNGNGFDVKEAVSARDRPRGLGLLGMRERVGLVNGVLTLESEPGQGTEITIEIPLEAKPHE
jgi:PAS domain S-box-containing protein